jgi:hypothetical protein
MDLFFLDHEGCIEKSKGQKEARSILGSSNGQNWCTNATYNDPAIYTRTSDRKK